jgi:hypothetical protein
MIYGTPEFDDVLKDIIKRKYRHPGYDLSVEHAEEMSWHIYGTKPKKLLERSRPNEDQAITDYRLENYEPTTKSAADKAIQILSKGFNPNLYSIRWEKDKESSDAQKLHDYTLEYYPKFNSVVNYTRDVVMRRMLADPNGVLAVKPYKIPELQSDELNPVACLYSSAALYDFDDEHYLVFIEKIKIDKVEYHIFEYFDKDHYIRFAAGVQTAGTKEILLLIDDDPEYNLFVYNYGFSIEEPPVWQLKGISETLDTGELFYKSYFFSAAPYWNYAIIHESDLFASYIRHLFPQRYELSENCKFMYPYEGKTFPCRGGHIKIGSQTDDKAKVIDCPHCHGSGWEPIGPLGVYRYVKEKLQDSGPLGVDPVGYINVPTDATKMLEDRVELMKRKGMWAINMDVEDEVGEVQSGAAKTIDRAAQYDTIFNICSVLFDVHLTNIYYYFNKFMFGVESKSLGKTEDENLPQINKPTQFDILSSAELIKNFEVSKKSGIDRNYQQVKQIQIVTTDLTTNPDLKMFTALLLDLDPLPGIPDEVVNSNVMSGYNSKQDAVIHFNLKAFVERALQESKGFKELDKDQKAEVLQGYADEFIKKNKATLNAPTEEKEVPA